jgi:Acetyltransferase (GNAT) family
MGMPVLTRCRFENLPILAVLDRDCFEDPLPADDLCSYLNGGTGDDSGCFFFETDRGTTESPIALLLSEYDSVGRLEPVGFLLLVLRDELGVIERIGIRPEHRQKGLARKALDSIRTASRALGVTVWSAEVPKTDIPGRDFFRNIGFLNACPTSDYPIAPQESQRIILWRPTD